MKHSKSIYLFLFALLSTYGASNAIADDGAEAAPASVAPAAEATEAAPAPALPTEDIWTEQPSENENEIVFLVRTMSEQAGAYIDRDKLLELWERYSSSSAKVQEVIRSIYAYYDCEPDGTYFEDDMFCGELNSPSNDNTVLWNFGRGGWAEAGASYHSFLTFLMAGSGHMSSMALEVVSAIDVSATAPMSDDDGSIEFLVTYKFLKLRVYDQEGAVEREIALP